MQVTCTCNLIDSLCASESRSRVRARCGSGAMPAMNFCITRIMRNEFRAIIERDDDRFIAHCSNIPGANGQGLTIPEALHSQAEAVSLILEDRCEDALRWMPGEAIRANGVSASMPISLLSDRLRGLYTEELRPLLEAKLFPCRLPDPSRVAVSPDGFCDESPAP